MAVVATAIALYIIAVLARVYMRRAFKETLYVDDLRVTPALVLTSIPVEMEFSLPGLCQKIYARLSFKTGNDRTI